MKTYLQSNWHWMAIIAILIFVIIDLDKRLQTAQDNEREMSKRNYQAVRQAK